jgi:polyphosphate kinase 2 (PPK2 family)
MLEKIDLDKTLSKDEYRKAVGTLEERIGSLQRAVKERGVPVIVVFEGWDAAGKGTLINRLLLAMDPRGFSVHQTLPPKEEELYRPFLWRFWINVPEKGHIAVFDRSWYERVLVDRVDGAVTKKECDGVYGDINAFERQLSDGGYRIIKFFLHISKGEQKKRFRKLEKSKATAWRVTDEDWRHHRQYDDYYRAVEDTIVHTDTVWAPWTIVEATDRRFATVKVFTVVADALEKGISRHGGESAAEYVTGTVLPDQISSTVLDSVDLSKSLAREAYEEELDRYQKKVRKLEHLVYVKRLPVVIVFQGWDAAGKGGNIRRLVQKMDPRGYEVIPVGAPNDAELNRHYLWRFWVRFPKAGHIAIFDRSWYGRVLVERVEGLASEPLWRRAYREINEMELQFIRFGTVLLKFWLHISPEEQLRRFEAREADPRKRWKITEEDWRNREKRDAYERAVNDMLVKTSTPDAPWVIVEAESKLYARIKVLKTVTEALEKRL